MDTADVNFAFKSNVIGQNVGFTGFNIQQETKASVQKASYPTTSSSGFAPYNIGKGDYGCLPTFSGVNTGNPIVDYTVNTVVGTYNFIASTVNTVPNALGAAKEVIDNTCQQVLGMDSMQLAHELYATGLFSQAGFALDAFNTWATLVKAANTSKVAQTAITASQVAANVGAGLVGIETSYASSKSFMNGKVGETELANMFGGKSQAYFKTTNGARYIDQLADGVAHESKVGYTSLTQFVKKQVIKDAEILERGDVDDVVWHFFQSGVSGKGGPSQPLADFLTENGIKYIIH